MPDSYKANFFFSISCFRFGVCDSVLHIVFVFWVSFCLIFWDIRHSGLVLWVILFWICLCFLLGIVYFCLGSFFLSSDSRWVIIFRFGYVCFCAGLAGYVFESCFLFLFLSATIFMYYEENMSLNFRNTTCSANHIDT